MRSDLIETFKIVNRKYDINPELFFQLDEGDSRGHDQKLFMKRFRLNVRKYAFSNRVIDNWNLLPAKRRNRKNKGEKLKTKTDICRRNSPVKNPWS